MPSTGYAVSFVQEVSRITINENMQFELEAIASSKKMLRFYC
jgi:hypothetical protein